ncbi:hypothetical protein OH77DRAFT_1434531 [Trametes cingulata]|nr:hypothetical protein OH77DRAFT_1434531 [Trametes cingulata]
MAGRKDRNDTDRIKRPSNSFFLFRSEYWHRWKAAQTSLNEPVRQSEFSRVVKEAWKSADQAEYKRRADILKAEHAQKYPDYKFRPRRKRKVAADEDSGSPEAGQRPGQGVSATTASTSIPRDRPSKKRNARPRPTTKAQSTMRSNTGAAQSVDDLSFSAPSSTAIRMPTVANFFPTVARNASYAQPALLPPSPQGLQDPPRLSRPSHVRASAGPAPVDVGPPGAGSVAPVPHDQPFRNLNLNNHSGRTQPSLSSVAPTMPSLWADSAIGDQPREYHFQPQGYTGSAASQRAEFAGIGTFNLPSSAFAPRNGSQTYQDPSAADDQENLPPVAQNLPFHYDTSNQPALGLYVPVPLQEMQETAQVPFDWYRDYTDQWQYSLAVPALYQDAYYEADVGPPAPYAVIEESEE